ncbi:hypothetical protein [Variovorax sp.]|jgi:hypothetical protein|uniref:hypothetical protein n=1 Tax=Variovorax TaxID=34072 RepID=UPI0011F4B16B|nr:hypothetical protein [Variovorax sp.]KAF1070732.1 MAG: hypothetical protein GAK39_01736 [Variovorax sp.]TAJ59930.1 MAG: hypothetical protein EPO53_28060 [Variovorax sp.]
MRQLVLHRQPLHRGHAATHDADPRAASARQPAADMLQPEADQELDKSASFWSTRRIRCFLLLVPGQRKPERS